MATSCAIALNGKLFIKTMNRPARANFADLNMFIKYLKN